jgi:catechol 2,3-dioxygenase-like lactoylglutathione lyase family enzyme
VQPVLPVPDLAAAVDWYLRVLGFELDFLHGEPAFYGRVKLGDRSWGDPIYIHLQQEARPIQPCGETRLHVGHDIDGLHAHVLTAGATVLQAPTDQAWGLREMILLAPGGHHLVLGAEIAAPAG